jgi:hypothetical protein
MIGSGRSSERDTRPATDAAGRLILRFTDAYFALSVYIRTTPQGIYGVIICHHPLLSLRRLGSTFCPYLFSQASADVQSVSRY